MIKEQVSGGQEDWRARLEKIQTVEDVAEFFNHPECPFRYRIGIDKGYQSQGCRVVVSVKNSSEKDNLVGNREIPYELAYRVAGVLREYFHVNPDGTKGIFRPDTVVFRHQTLGGWPSQDFLLGFYNKTGEELEKEMTRLEKDLKEKGIAIEEKYNAFRVSTKE